MIYDETDEVIKVLFDSLKDGDKKKLEFMNGSEFVFNYIHECYKCHKPNLSCGRSSIDSPDWIKNKKATISAINKKR